MKGETMEYLKFSSKEVSNVYDYIKFGKESAKTSEEISAKLNLTPRRVRACIAELRKDLIIINDQDGKGYYRPTGTAEALRWYAQEYSRAMSLLKRLKPTRRLLKTHGIDVLNNERKIKKEKYENDKSKHT